MEAEGSRFFRTKHSICFSFTFTLHLNIDSMRNSSQRRCIWFTKTSVASLQFHSDFPDDPTSFLVLTAVFQLTEGVGLPFIDAILAGLGNVTSPGTNTTVGPVDLSPVVAALTTSSLTNYLYSGSLTTPPCTEGVMFLIPAEQIPITVAQFNALKRVMKFNSRYTQNELGDVNLLQVASGNDSAVSETANELAALGETEELPLEYV